MSIEQAMKKVATDPSNLEHFINTFSLDGLLTQAIAYNGSNLTEYIGYAPAGSSQASPVWLIKKLTYSGSLVTDIQFASGETAFDKVWDDRASYSYS